MKGIGPGRDLVTAQTGNGNASTALTAGSLFRHVSGDENDRRHQLMLHRDWPSLDMKVIPRRGLYLYHLSVGCCSWPVAAIWPDPAAVGREKSASIAAPSRIVIQEKMRGLPAVALLQHRLRAAHVVGTSESTECGDTAQLPNTVRTL
jgi:hypothetical protein